MGERGAPSLRFAVPDTQQLAENPMRANRFAADSVDVVERGHDMSYTLDLGYCSGARYECAAKCRSRHQIF